VPAAGQTIHVLILTWLSLLGSYSLNAENFTTAPQIASTCEAALSLKCAKREKLRRTESALTTGVAAGFWFEGAGLNRDCDSVVPEREGTSQDASVRALQFGLRKGGGAMRGSVRSSRQTRVREPARCPFPVSRLSGRADLGQECTFRTILAAETACVRRRMDPLAACHCLPLPAIAGQTDKGLPRYLDAQDSDVVMLSGSEDLVLIFRRKAHGTWDLDDRGDFKFEDDTRDGYPIRRYQHRGSVCSNRALDPAR